jgi:hypothetical protein
MNRASLLHLFFAWAIATVYWCLPAHTAVALQGTYTAHDPSTMIQEANKYWVFATGPGCRARYSFDRSTWFAAPHVFTNLPAWINTAVPGNNGDVWAPDVMFFNNRFHLYYSVSRFGENESVIGLATSPTLDPPAWTDRGLVIESNAGDNFNTIDPSIIRDAAGGLWLSFGSYWSGIKLVPIDPLTGKRLGSVMHSIAARPNTSIEASYIFLHNGYYYLFVNYDRCCAGINSTYNIRVGRSASITGPYRDRNGVDMLSGGGNEFLVHSANRLGPGHMGIFADANREWFTYHYYDALDNGAAKLGIKRLHWDGAGWPVAEWFSTWPFDADSRDDSMLFPGTLLNGASIIRDSERGNVLALSGPSQGMAISGDAATAYSFAMWVQWHGGAPSQPLIDFRSPSGGRLFLTPRAPSGRISFSITRPGGGSLVEGGALASGVWTHLAATFDGRAGRLYINGLLAGSNTAMNVLPEDIAPTNTIGYIGRDYATNSFNGFIDDVVFTSRVLSAQEIHELAGPQLIHRYSFNDPPGSALAFDSVGGAHGALLGGALLTGNGRLSLDGLSGYVNLPNGMISGLPGVTFEAWFTWNGGGAWQRLFDFGSNSNGEDAAGTGINYIYFTPQALNNTGPARFTASTNAGPGEILVINRAAIPIDLPMHVIASYNFVSGKMALYLGGHRVGLDHAGFPLSSINDYNNWIGRSNWPDPFFNGDIDEFRIYRGGMTDAQAALSFAAGPAGIPAHVIAPVRLIPAGAIWKYNDTGLNLGTAWRATNYNDNSWLSGRAELGYGDGDEATQISYGGDPTNRHITTYFRHAFHVPDPALYTSLMVSVLRDDGCVLYLNGTEIFRSNIGPNPAFGTTASNAPEDGTIPQIATVNPSWLRVGANLLAAEIHQASSSSSDLSFDLELIALPRGPDLPRLTIARLGTNAVLSWPANFTGFVLESAPNPRFGWTESPGTGVIQNGMVFRTNSITDAFRFFRLQN